VCLCLAHGWLSQPQTMRGDPVFNLRRVLGGLPGQLGQDLRFAARLYRRTPLVTAVIVASLALGIGANTALYSLADALLLRALPAVRAPERLVLVKRQGPRGEGPIMTYAGYRSLRAGSAPAVDLLASGWVWRWNLAVDGAPAERVAGELVSGNYFRALGVDARLGRLFDRDDAGAQVVLSHAYWHRRFGGDPGVVGRAITLNGATFTVVAVAAPGFIGETLGDPVDVWTPLANQPLLLEGQDWLRGDGVGWLYVLGRLAPGVSAPQARSVMDAAYAAWMAGRGRRNDERVVVSDGRWGLSVLRAQMGRPMLFLGLLVGLVLLVACGNVATLQLARAHRRQRELALRLALGGGRGRLVRQLLAESLLLSSAGAALGLLLAWLGSEPLLALLFPGAGGLPVEVTLNGRVLLYTAALGVLTGLLAGMFPAWLSRRVDPGQGLKQGSGATQRLLPLSGIALPIAQIALSCVLLVGAGLFARSLTALRAADPGFDRQRLLAVRLDAQSLRHTPAQFAGLYRRLLDLGAALPGARGAALADQASLRGGLRQANPVVEGFASPPGEAPAAADWLGVSPEFFATVGTPVIAGRGFDAADVAPGAARVAVVSRGFARVYFGQAGGHPAAAVGRRFGLQGRRSAGDIRIVGVVEDARHGDLRDATTPIIYSPLGPRQFPAREFSYSETTLVLRTAGDPRALAQLARRRIAEAEPQLPVIGVATVDQQVERSLGRDRLLSVLALLFGGLALLLTAAGVYGVLSYGVSLRRREIGVRAALGARPGQIGWLVGRRSLFMLGAGLLAGLPAGVAAALAARSLLYGVSPADPATFAAALAILGVTTLLASCGPARAAVRTDPMIAMRAE
jgi:predicted permease